MRPFFIKKFIGAPAKVGRRKYLHALKVHPTDVTLAGPRKSTRRVHRARWQVTEWFNTVLVSALQIVLSYQNTSETNTYITQVFQDFLCSAKRSIRT